MKYICIVMFVVTSLMSTLSNAAEEIDRETPEYQTLEAGLWLLNAGGVAEDLQVIKAFLYAENDPKLALVEAHARRIVASKHFTDAAFKVFPQKVAQLRVKHRMVDGGNFGYVLLGSTWLIHGDTATPDAEAVAQYSKDGMLPRLVNRRGIWKVDVTPTPLPTAAQTEALATLIHRHAKIVDETATAITRGRLKTVEEVQNALKHVPEFAPAQFTPDIILSLPPAGNSTGSFPPKTSSLEPSPRQTPAGTSTISR